MQNFRNICFAIFAIFLELQMAGEQSEDYIHCLNSLSCSVPFVPNVFQACFDNHEAFQSWQNKIAQGKEPDAEDTARIMRFIDEVPALRIISQRTTNCPQQGDFILHSNSSITLRATLLVDNFITAILMPKARQSLSRGEFMTSLIALRQCIYLIPANFQFAHLIYRTLTLELLRPEWHDNFHSREFSSLFHGQISSYLLDTLVMLEGRQALALCGFLTVVHGYADAQANISALPEIITQNYFLFDLPYKGSVYMLIIPKEDNTWKLLVRLPQRENDKAVFLLSEHDEQFSAQLGEAWQDLKKQLP